MHHFLYTYGTLMCEDIMNAVAGFCHKAFPARLQDFRRLAVKNASYPGIIRAEGYVVDGWVYGGISDAALSLLDRFEGDMYERLRVLVHVPEGIQREVFAYAVKNEFKDRLEPRDWDFDAFLKNGKNDFLR